MATENIHHHAYWGDVGILGIGGWEALGDSSNVAATGGHPGHQRLRSSRRQGPCCDDGGKSWESEAAKL